MRDHVALLRRHGATVVYPLAGNDTREALGTGLTLTASGSPAGRDTTLGGITTGFDNTGSGSPYYTATSDDRMTGTGLLTVIWWGLFDAVGTRIGPCKADGTGFDRDWSWNVQPSGNMNVWRGSSSGNYVSLELSPPSGGWNDGRMRMFVGRFRPDRADVWVDNGALRNAAAPSAGSLSIANQGHTFRVGFALGGNAPVDGTIAMVSVHRERWVPDAALADLWRSGLGLGLGFSRRRRGAA